MLLTYDVFVLTDPTTPFEQDQTGLREPGERRALIHGRCRDYARSTDARVVEVFGSRGERADQAAQVIDDVIRRGAGGEGP